jgi:hypothetical protein
MECTEGGRRGRRRVTTSAYEDPRVPGTLTAKRSGSTPSTAKRLRSRAVMLTMSTAPSFSPPRRVQLFCCGPAPVSYPAHRARASKDPKLAAAPAALAAPGPRMRWRHDGQQRGHLGAQPPGQRQGQDATAEPPSPSAPASPPAAAAPGSARCSASAYGPPRPAPRAAPARGAGRQTRHAPAGTPHHTRLRQRRDVPAIGLHLPLPRRVHRGEVRVRQDHLVAQPLQAPGHPLTLRRRLGQNPSPHPVPQRLGQARQRGAHPPLDQFPPSAIMQI